MFHPKGPSLVQLAKQALSSTTKGYDLLATKFEYTPFRTPDEVLGPLSDAIGEGGPYSAGLDVCCGTGAAMRALRPHCSAYVTGIDLSSEMLEEGARLLKEAPGEAELRFLVQDALSMEFDEEFDVATSCGAFGHILPHQQDEFIARIRAALKPGGRFIFATRSDTGPSDTWWWVGHGFNAVMHVRNALIRPPFIMFYLLFTESRARALLERAGFEVDVREPYARGRFRAMRLVVATKR